MENCVVLLNVISFDAEVKVGKEKVGKAYKCWCHGCLTEKIKSINVGWDLIMLASNNRYYWKVHY